MAVTNADILGWFNANPGASDALIAQTMQEAGVSPTRLAEVTGAPVAQVASLFQAAIAAPVAPTVAPTPAPANPAVTNADILGWFNANPNADATLVNQTMQAAGVSPSQVSSALASNPDVAKTYLTQQILGQGTTEKWTGEGKGSPQANAADMANILAGIGITDVSQFGQLPDGSFGNKLTGQPVPNTYSERQTGNAFGGTFAGKGNTGYRVEFDAQGKPLFYTTGASSSDVPSWVKPALILGGAYLGLNAAGLLGGAAPAAGSAFELANAGAGAFGGGSTGLLGGAAGAIGSDLAGLSGIPAGTGALTAAESAALYGTGSALGGTGVIGSDLAGLSGIPTGTGALTAAEMAALYGTGATGAGLEFAGSGGAFDLANAGIAGGASGFTAAELAAIGAGTATGIGSVAGGAGGGSLIAGLTPAQIAAGELALPAVSGLGGAALGNLLTSGLTLGGGVLQSETARKAAVEAQARIDAETAAAKASAAFRPIGMTTRFGTSQFQVDPVTGQLVSAGYTLSPEAKAQQDRFMALSNAGLTQAEQAPTQFAPLKTGAERLFGLGNQYLAQTPEQVAQNYLTQQMNLLAPSREIELANLQTKLRNQGRIGLSVAQGGDYGATTPELQALYNARARQEAELAANAQLAGQRDVTFGAGLLNQGAQTMGQYYTGQQAAYAPYTTAMGQVQGLEALGQQPLTTGINLGQISSTAGANVGKLGLTGAQLSTNLATSAAATTNPYASILGGLGASPALGTLGGGLLSSLFS